MKTMRMWIALLGCLAMVVAAGCSSDDDTYQPPNLGSGTDGLTIDDAPLTGDGPAEGQAPDPGEYTGYVFQARAGEVYDLDLERTSGDAVLAMALYQFDQGAWSDPLVWATADADSIGIGGWSAPVTGTYLVLIEAVSGGGSGGFALMIQCTEGCDDPLVCAANADCPDGMVCWEGMCFEDNVECRTDADCRAGEICEQGFCVEVCVPSVEICDDGLDNDCDGEVDEGCGLPCADDADCPADQFCRAGQCIDACGCASDADCPMGHVCEDCMCVPACEEDADGDGFCAPEDCDDRNPAVHPYAADVCDGLDNDCDGEVDEGCDVCRTDADCPAGQLCDAATGQCVLACSANADCPAGQLCVNGVCQAGCASDADCAAGEVCVDNLCQAACEPEICGDGLDNDCDGLIDEDCGLPCASDADCPAGQLCDAATGQCVGGCASDADCAIGELCVDGLCVAPCDRDADGDGYLAIDCGGTDCDDADPTVHPGAPEDCNGLDDDCDGQVDEGCSVNCSTNADCAAGQVCLAGRCVAACASDADCAAGQVCVDGLCEDVCLPGMEICNGMDDDCDGLVDEDFDLLSDPSNCGACGQACAAGEACLNGACTQDLPCASDADCAADEMCVNNVCVAACDTDADGDGYLAAACGGTDCDDYDATINPGAEEFCDGLDNDCDGQVDEACTLYCRSDADCPAGQMCMNGVCVAG